MNDIERYSKYTAELCSNCKNRENCTYSIGIVAKAGMVITKCKGYEKDKPQKGYKKPLERTAKMGHAVMKGLIADWRSL